MGPHITRAEAEWGLLMAILDYLESIGYGTDWELAHRIFRGVYKALTEEEDADRDHADR